MNINNFSLILSTFIVLLMVRKTYSAAVHIPNSVHPDHPGMCYFKDDWSPEESKTPFFLKPGQQRRHPKNCYGVFCDDQLGLRILGCGPGIYSNQCRSVAGDKSKPYPHCCPEIIC